VTSTGDHDEYIPESKLPYPACGKDVLVQQNPSKNLGTLTVPEALMMMMMMMMRHSSKQLRIYKINPQTNKPQANLKDVMVRE